MSRTPSTNALAFRLIETPLGLVGYVAGPRGLLRVFLPGSAGEADAAIRREFPSCRSDAGLLPDFARELHAYFDGRLRRFHVPFVLEGTPFQRSVWRATSTIAYGQTATYQALARSIGRPRAARAVGGALGANPLPLVIPCHRVVAAGGKLGGYTGGLALKRALLALEQSPPTPARPWAPGPAANSHGLGKL